MLGLLGQEEEVVVECETDWEVEHSWTVRGLNQTFPVPEELVTRLASRSGSRLGSRTALTLSRR